MTERRLKDWLTSFKEWTMPRSECPESMLEWCGLFCLSTALRRHIVVTDEYLGGWKCYPSIYIMFIAPQGIVKKSTSIGFVEELLDEVSGIEKSPDAVTIPDLLQRIQNAEESSVYILSTEFSTLVNKAGLGVYDILTDLYDGKKKIDEGTISRGYVFASAPCLNMLAATTPKWVGANMTEDIIGGGYGSRIIAIHEDTPRQRILMYKKRLKHLRETPSFAKLKVDLIHDLIYISSKLKGEFQLSDDAQDFLDNERGTGWYNKNAEAPKGTDSRLIGYYQRRPAHIIKVAMLLHCGRTDDLILDVPVLEEAIALMTRMEPKIANVYKAIGRNVYALDMVNIVKFISEQQNGRVARTELLRTFNSTAEPIKMDELLTHLIQMETIKITTENQEIYYEFKRTIDLVSAS